MKDTKLLSVDAYIKAIPSPNRKKFLELHELITSTAKASENCLSYGMPAIKQNGMVIYYACWEKHLAIYPMPSALKHFADELDEYVTSKSTIQFPFDEPLPKKLIKEIVKFRLKENIEKAAIKKASKKK